MRSMIVFFLAWVGMAVLSVVYSGELSPEIAEGKPDIMFVFVDLDRPLVTKKNGVRREVVGDRHDRYLKRKEAWKMFEKKIQARLAGWDMYRGELRVPCGRAPALASMLYGVSPLEVGVVCDVDWRRKPVMKKSLADELSESGYQTLFWGDWGMGEGAPYLPKMRGFAVDEHVRGDAWKLQKGKEQVDWLRDKKKHEKNEGKMDHPRFVFLRSGGFGNREFLTDVTFKKCQTSLSELSSRSEARQGGGRRPCVIVFIFAEMRGDDGDGAEKDKKNTIHSRMWYRSANWVIYRHGEVAHFSQLLERLKKSRNVWDLHHGVLGLVGEKTEGIESSAIYHRGGWSGNEAYEKYRHRGSLVLGNDAALVNGLELFALDRRGGVDFSSPLDISKHPRLHQRLLMQYGKWWTRVRTSLRDPRAFDVGGDDADLRCVSLTAQDWRPSKIIDLEGNSPVYDPPASIHDVEVLLRGLKGDADYRQSFPAYSGSWSLRILKPGRYKISARLFPQRSISEKDQRGEEDLASLNGGLAHIKLGGNEVVLRIQKRATSVAVMIDADAGVVDLECWFTGQLSLSRELGAFFVDVERVGEKKFKMKISR